jgi:uncharacterized protein (TIGR02996 family)
LTGADLARASAQIDGRDLAVGLDVLLATWRAEPDPALATRIERLTTIMSPALPPLAGKNPAQQHDAWLVLAGAARAVDVPVLAEHLDQPPGTRVRARLTWLATRPADPRWTPYLVQMLGRRWTVASRSDARISMQTFKVLRSMADPRSPGMLRALDITTRGYWDRDFDEWLARIDKAIAAITAVEPAVFVDLDAALTRAQARPAPRINDLRVERGARTEAQVRAMVYDDPADIDTRRVYADWLEQAAVPRAEFQTLQLKRIDGRLLKREEKRERALLTRHGLGWLGALAPFVGDVDWWAGFPTGADIKFRGRKARDKALADPAWQTLTEASGDDPAVFDHPHLAGVRQLGRTSNFNATAQRLTPMSAQTLGDLRVTRDIERLVVAADDLHIINMDAFGALRALEVVHARLGGFGPSELHRYIERLKPLVLDRMTFWGVEMRIWSQLVPLFEGVQRYEVCDIWGFRCALQRERGGWRLEAVWPWPRPCHDISALVDCVRRFDPTRVDLRTPGYNHPAATLARWTAAFGERAVHMPKPRRARSQEPAAHIA